MHKYPIFKYSFVLVALFFSVIAQSQQVDSVSNGSLTEQFNSLIENSETYNEYKVIKQEKLNAFKKVIADTLKEFNQIKEEATSNINAQQATIESLNASINEKDSIINSGEEEKSNLAVLGIKINKQTYAVISLIIPLLLIVVIVVLFIKMKNDSIDTKAAKKSLISVEKEFDDYKKRALDNQMKLKRELQTARNKLLEYNK